MAYYKVQVQISTGEWVYPDEEWDSYVFDTDEAAQACVVRVRQIPEFKDLDVRVYEAGRYELCFVLDNVIHDSWLFDTVELGREALIKARANRSADWKLELYDTVDDVMLEVQ